ncbi:MAG: glycosyltransferase family 4 protein [Planctomycetes bacterium]|nr:glycosyltransferase family 4 protein [Planctomycetota bacterium]
MAKRRGLPTAERDSQALHQSRGVTLRSVAFLVPGFDLDGGMEGQARSLARGLAEEGVPSTVVTTLAPGLDLPLHEPLGLVEVFRVPTSAHLDWHTAIGVFELAALGILRSRVQRLNLIYAVHHETGAMAARIGQSLELPVVVKLACSGSHGDAAAVFAHRDRARIQAGLQDAERVIAISEDLAREARDLLGIDPTRIVRLPNGVDRHTFRPRPWREDLPARVLFVGRLSPQKRVDVLLEAFARVASENPDLKGLELILAGDGPLRGELEAKAQTLGISERTTFLGGVDRETVVELLRDAKLVALPSESEGASNSVLEALATGVPVVATDLPGTREQVRHEQEGLLVPVGDVAALSEAIARLLKDDELYMRLAAAAEERSAEFDIERVAAAHLKLFEAVAVLRDERPQDATPLFSQKDLPLALQAGSTVLRTAGRGARSVLRTLRSRLL